MKIVNLVKFTDLLFWGERNKKGTWNELCHKLDNVAESVKYESHSCDYTEDEIKENDDEWLSSFAKNFLLDYMKDENIKEFTLVND